MGATDNAFIKVFDQAHPVRRSSRPSRAASGVMVSANVITVDAGACGQPVVSEIYAGAVAVRPVVVSTVGARSNQHENSQPKGRRVLRSEDGHPSLPQPHIRPTVFAAAAVGDSVAKGRNLRIDLPVSEPTAKEPAEVAAQQTAQDEARTIARLDQLEQAASPDDARHANIQSRLDQQRQVHESRQAESTIRLEPRSRTARTWFPQWEVDQFRWPPICDSLNERATSELFEAVRPILNSAWRGKNVVAVTSFDQGEGGTTVSLCLARMAASFRVPVAIVDGDQEVAGLGAALGISFDRGWNDITKGTSLNEVAIASVREKLVAVPINVHQPAVDLDVSVAGRMIDELAEHFELVLIDAGPIYSAAHSWFASPLCDRIHSTIIIRNLRATTSRQISDVCSRLTKTGMNDIAVVENFSQT